jgi:hypothetical protein
MWNGMFWPTTTKHRHHPKTHHPQHLINHLKVDSIEPIDSVDEGLTILGDGEIEWLIRIHFIENESEKYEYIYESDEEPSENEVLEAIALDLNSKRK